MHVRTHLHTTYYSPQTTPTLPPDVKLRDRLAERAVQEFKTAKANPSIDLAAF